MNAPFYMMQTNKYIADNSSFVEKRGAWCNKLYY